MIIIDNNALLYTWGKIKDLVGKKQDILKAGNHIVIKDNTIEATFDNATQDTTGLMSANDKKTLDNLEAGAVRTVKVNGTALTQDSANAVDVTVETGSANGTVSVNGKDVPVKGLGSGAYAEKVVVDTALSSSSTNPVQNKSVASAINAKANTASPVFTGTPTAPTAATGTNNMQLATTAFVQTAVNNGVARVKQRREIVDTLPETGDELITYLVPHTHSDANDGYDEYIWITGSKKFEKVGNTDIDLSGYLKTTDITAITNAEIDAICV